MSIQNDFPPDRPCPEDELHHHPRLAGSSRTCQNHPAYLSFDVFYDATATFCLIRPKILWPLIIAHGLVAPFQSSTAFMASLTALCALTLNFDAGQSRFRTSILDSDLPR